MNIDTFYEVILNKNTKVQITQQNTLFKNLKNLQDITSDSDHIIISSKKMLIIFPKIIQLNKEVNFPFYSRNFYIDKSKIYNKTIVSIVKNDDISNNSYLFLFYFKDIGLDNNKT